MSRHACALPFGATLLAPDRARFRLWAPSQQAVLLELEGAAPRALQAVGGGWHELEAECTAGARYQYRLANDRLVPDPASRAQAGGVHGPSVVVNPRAYDWQHDGWLGRPWRETVLYEVHVGACGGYENLTRQLPALAETGITAIELMPLADFAGTRNWGYDGVLPFAPAATYGPPEALKAFIDAAHGLKLNVFLDVVYNHFGPDGNHLHAYAPGFFREDRQTPWGAAIDFRRREVRDFFIGNALYWLEEFRFDGLRLDAVHAIKDTAVLDELAATVRARIQGSEPQREVHLVLENEDNDAVRLAPGRFDAQWNDDAHNALHVLLTGEREGYYGAYAGAPAEHLARCLGEGFSYQGGAFPGRKSPRGTPSGHLRPGSFVFFLQNHDQVGNRAQGERLCALADPEALWSATVLQLLCPQIPLLFMGEDWGAREPFLFFTDFTGELADAVREGRRREFANFKAWADPVARESIPDPNDASTFRRSMPDFTAATRGAGAARRAAVRDLLALRARHIAPYLDAARALGGVVLSAAAVCGEWQLGGARLTVAANFGAASAAMEPMAHVPLYRTAPGVAAAAAKGRLPPRSAAAWLEPAHG
ncbi:MAG TPA: malto-oligosyltrehalose trehalohydrolase [Verrucomicrobiae bacterium]|nr:malto-oligosyltrehalose trehalohydrolase [Verrucomicrobiae bacterium]